MTESPSSLDSLEPGPTPFTTPVLVVFWTRPEAVAQIIKRLKVIQPIHLFLACDGHRPGRDDEAMQILEARRVAEQQIDWPCTVEKRYCDTNQGVKHGVFNAISWFFSFVDEGIILEDDTLPDESFFYFCRDMLHRYRHDTRIWQISGSNLFQEASSDQATYFFSGLGCTWAWATWRRCWSQFDLAMTSWPEFQQTAMTNAFDTEAEATFWGAIWTRIVASDSPLAWDYQWLYTRISNSALSIVPRVNLVSNIGFGPGATNCLDPSDISASLVTGSLVSIEHPPFILKNRAYDQALFQKVYLPIAPKHHERLIKTLRLRSYYTVQGIAKRIFGLIG